MSETRGRSNWTPSSEQAAGGLVAGAGKIMSTAGKTMLRDAPKAARIVLKSVPGTPGLVLDGASIFKAKDRWRAGSEVAGGMAGAAIGGLVGGPVGAAIGATVGQKGAELLYDEYGDDVRRGAGNMATWMKEREEAIARGLLNDLQRYTRPPQFRQRY